MAFKESMRPRPKLDPLGGTRDPLSDPLTWAQYVVAADRERREREVRDPVLVAAERDRERRTKEDYLRWVRTMTPNFSGDYDTGLEAFKRQVGENLRPTIVSERIMNESVERVRRENV